MCGRYVFKGSLKNLQDLYGAEPDADIDFSPVYNVAPTFDMPIIRQESDRRVVSLYRWGLLPFWAKDEKVSYKMINARAETIDEKPSFREAFRKRRCIVPASGFYEWQKTPQGKVPHYITSSGNGFLSLAGLYEHWKDRNGRLVNSYTIITTDANDIMKPLHDRMPAILFGREIDQWLRPAEQNAAHLKELLRPCPGDAITYHPVSTRVNSPRNQGAELIEQL